MIPWYWWVATGAVGSVSGMVLTGRGLLADYNRPFAAKLIVGIVLILVSTGVGTVPVGFPQFTGVETAPEVCG